jgi:outer membrane protein assembly factor BamB
VCALLVVIAGCDWAAAGFGPANTHFNPSEPALTESSVKKLKVAWYASCACAERALVAGGRVYVVDGFSGSGPYSLTLRAFDGRSGKPAWSTPLGTSDFGTVLNAVANGLVYVLMHPSSASDRVVAVDAATGVPRWDMTPPEPGSGRVALDGPIIVDGPLAFVAARIPTRSDIFAIDTAGHVAWSASPGGGVKQIAADPAQQTLYTLSLLQLTSGPSIYLLTGYAEADGTVRSAVSAQLRPISLSVVQSLGFANGLVYGTQANLHGEGGAGAFALHPDTGALAWSGDGGEKAITPSAVVDFNLRADPNTIARNPSTGAVLWQMNFAGEPQAVAGNLVYGFDWGDAILVRRISDGTAVATVKVVAGDTIGALTPSAGHVYDVTRAHLYALAPS